MVSRAYSAQNSPKKRKSSTTELLKTWKQGKWSFRDRSPFGTISSNIEAMKGRRD